MREKILVLLALGFAACADDRRGGTLGNDAGNGTDASNVSMTDGGFVTTPPAAIVYAHSATSLYSIDPDTFFVTLVGPFVWPSGSDEMTDIALDKNGNMVGVSYSSIYSVDKASAKCTFLSNFSGSSFNGLSFIAADQIDASGAEILVGASSFGEVYKIDPTNGAQTLLGSYGGDWGSSGDIVSVAGATYATVSKFLDTSDTLVTVNATTGKATVVGSTGTSRIWGLGYWKQKLFGFTETQGMVTINITTGVATPVAGGNNINWYGAGVTTAAPTTIQ